MSDLHLDFWRDKGEFCASLDPTGVDALVLAGDIGPLTNGGYEYTLARMKEFCARYPWVFYVAGNHEFYGTSIAQGRRNMRRLEEEVENLVCLDIDWSFCWSRNMCHEATVPEQEQRHFHGHTMWMPEPTEEEKEYVGRIVDHRHIHFYTDPSEGVHVEHERFRKMLAARTYLGPKHIVVTHHAPSVRSVSPEFEGDPDNHWFVVPGMSEEIERLQPALWVHGHMHQGFDYTIGKTRVICNPRGYPGERRGPFNPKLVVEI